MPYISPETVKKAKQMDLFSYLQAYEPHELVHFSGNTYCTKTHDSLKISNGRWCWFSKGIGGRSALDYLIKVKSFSFVEAVEQITGQVAHKSPVFNSQTKQQSSRLLLPNKSPNNEKAICYLLSRGIEQELITHFIKEGQLYESIPNHSVVFVGKDNFGTPKYACIRGIGESFYMGNATGSDRHYSFAVNATQQNDTVHLFESAIDLLSFASILIMQNKNWQSENLVSLSGIYQSNQNISQSKIPAALETYLENYPDIKNIIFHLDNDKAGRLATQAIMAVLPKQYITADSPPPSGKDYNDYLCDMKHIKRCNYRKPMHENYKER